MLCARDERTDPSRRDYPPLPADRPRDPPIKARLSLSDRRASSPHVRAPCAVRDLLEEPRRNASRSSATTCCREMLAVAQAPTPGRDALLRPQQGAPATRVGHGLPRLERLSVLSPRRLPDKEKAAADTP